MTRNRKAGASGHDAPGNQGRRALHGLVLGLVLFVSTMPAAAGGDVNLFAGTKRLDDQDWSPVEDQLELGIHSTVDVGPVGIAVDLLRGEDSDEVGLLEFDSVTIELNVGARKVWRTSRARPFVGGGVAWVHAKADIAISGFASSDVDDSDVGYWIDAGVLFRLGRHFNLGLDARYSRAELSPGGFDAKAGGEHLGLLVGYGW